MTQQYELMFIVPGSLDDTQVPDIKNRVVSLITQADGTIVTDVDLGRRRLAYSIKRQTSGHYVVLQFAMPQAAISSLDKTLQLDSEILRHLLVKAPVRAAADIQTMLKEPERKTLVEVKSEPAPVAVQDFGPTVRRDDPAPGETKNITVEAETPAAQPIGAATTDGLAPVEDSNATIEALDKKLDAILDDTDINLKL